MNDGNTGLRLLSENECKAIMGFPLDFKFPVSRTQMYRQMGEFCCNSCCRQNSQTNYIYSEYSGNLTSPGHHCT